MKTYAQVHAGLLYVRGLASAQTCPCGAPAKQWAYQHNAGDQEIRDANNENPYSENLLEHYAAMCGTCHALLDKVGVKGRAAVEARRAGDPDFAWACVVRARAHAEEARKAVRERRQDPAVVEAHRVVLQQNAVKARAAWASKRAADPLVTQVLREAALKVNAQRRTCDECGRPSTPSGMTLHQRGSGHVGWTAL